VKEKYTFLGYMLKLEVEYCQFNPFLKIWKLEPLKKVNKQIQKKSFLGSKIGWWLQNEIVFMNSMD